MREKGFGGAWTADKLDVLRKYLAAYTRLFEGNQRAHHFTRIYVDAFAGTGSVPGRGSDSAQTSLFPRLTNPDAKAFLKGSARIALEVRPPFHQYVFIERNARRRTKLDGLRTQYPDRNIEIVGTDANEYLRMWCDCTDWSRSRAVVFIDPFGMQVAWDTIAAISKTHAIDLLVLFPLGSAINRLLTRDEPPGAKWQQALTRVFGTDTWLDAFYQTMQTTTLFGQAQTQRGKIAKLSTVTQFFINRLKTVFPGVLDSPLFLYNSRNNPIFVLCFAAGNPNGAPVALKIARDILGGAKVSSGGSHAWPRRRASNGRKLRGTR